MTFRWMGCLAAAMLSTPLIAAGQNANKPDLLSVAHVALRVTDMEAEVQFLGKIGFEVGFDEQRNGKRAFVFVKVNDGEFFEVIPYNKEGKDPLGFSHVCFVTTDANAEHDKWAAGGLNPTPVTDGPDQTREFGAKTPAGGVTEALQIVPKSQPYDDKGQHLGAHRISQWLAGVDMPVDNVAAWQSFYEKIGFTPKKEGSAVRMVWPTKSDMEIVLRPAAPNEKVKILLAVPDVKKAADQLRSAGLKVDMDKNQAVVPDIDGNLFVFTKI